jgi:hypothetical protein
MTRQVSIGRDSEVDNILRYALSAAATGTPSATGTGTSTTATGTAATGISGGQVVLVQGDLGAGKSHVLRHVWTRIQQQSASAAAAASSQQMRVEMAWAAGDAFSTQKPFHVWKQSAQICSHLSVVCFIPCIYMFLGQIIRPSSHYFHICRSPTSVMFIHPSRTPTHPICHPHPASNPTTTTTTTTTTRFVSRARSFLVADSHRWRARNRGRAPIAIRRVCTRFRRLADRALAADQ